MSVTSTSNTAPITETYALPETKKQSANELKKDDFLTLLIAQLQNQDPTSPMDNQQMVQQLVQFSNMESMNNMSTASVQTQTYAMLGKGVQGNVRTPEGELIATDVIGVVESAGTYQGKPYVMVSGQRIFAADISNVFEQSVLTGAQEAVNTATSMVGAYVRANVGTSAEPVYITGRATRWQLQDGVVYLSVNDKDVALAQIVTVAESEEALGDAPAAPVTQADTANTESSGEPEEE